MVSVLARLIPNARELGPLNAAVYDVNRLLAKLGGFASVVRYVFVAQPVPEAASRAPARGRTIAVELIAPTDPALTALDADLTPTVLAYRRDLGSVCFAARKDGGTIGCLWLCFGAYDEDVLRARYRPLPAATTAWDFGVYVAPAQRAGFAFSRLWETANAYLRARGVAWSCSRIDAANAASLRAHARLGAVTVGTATFLTIGRLQIMMSRLKPRLHVSFSADNVPELLIPSPQAAAPPSENCR